MAKKQKKEDKQIVLENKILETKPIEWRELKWLQGGLKEISDESFQKLKKSIKENNFIQPFNVWDGWILDGHHRLKALKEIEKEGVSIPNLLPANIMKCKDKKEASKLVLVYSSTYAKVTPDGLTTFMFDNELDIDDLGEIDLEAMEEILGKIDIIPSPVADDKAPTFTTNVSSDKTAFYINRIYGVVQKDIAERFAEKFGFVEGEDDENGVIFMQIMERLINEE